MVTLFNPQYIKALSPIEITESGITIFFIELHHAKAKGPIAVTKFGSVISDRFPMYAIRVPSLSIKKLSNNLKLLFEDRLSLKLTLSLGRDPQSMASLPQCINGLFLILSSS